MSKIMHFLTIFWCIQWVIGTTEDELDFEKLFQCDEIHYCPKNFKPYKDEKSNRFQILRKEVLQIINLQQNGIEGIRNNSRFSNLISTHYSICSDDTAGFILDENVDDYEISCVWTGAIQFGKCVPVPSKYSKKPFNFIHGNEWAQKVNAVRDALGCHKWENIKPEDFELFICNERCIQGGVGFLASILILVTLTFSFCKNCA